MTPRRSDRPIPTSRLLVGILLHFCVPAYLLACLAAAFLKAPVVASWGEVPARMLWTAAWFVPAFVIVTAAAAGVGSLLDRRQPRPPDPVVESRAALTDGRRRFAAIADARLTAALARLDAARWDHSDPRHQAVAVDLAAAARTFAAAHDSAAPEGRAAVLALAADSVARLADAMDSFDAQRRRLDEGDARTIAGYLAARYGDAASQSPPR